LAIAYHGDNQETGSAMKLLPTAKSFSSVLLAGLCLSGAGVSLAQTVMTQTVMTQPVPSAIYTDPAVDAAHPARMEVLHIPTHGVLINGLVYAPPGAGTHPTLVICHGLPGNEKNLDLAQAVRRAGWNAVTFNYRGSWGSPGSFRFGQCSRTCVILSMP
jgi:predicted alpha/beta-fold hydrolase